tara:strand:- start:133 stop:477 length:345 start_codon:yes stop_codon:yes gene_type:complete
MKITQVKISKFNQGSCLGLASITFENIFVVTGIRIMNSEKTGRFISMPPQKDKNGNLVKNKEGRVMDLCFPLSKDFRETISSYILDEYNKAESGYEEPKLPEVTMNEEPDDLPF